MTTEIDKRAAWREKNRERIRAYDRARYPERAIAEREKVAAWRKRYPERARQIAASWREKNRERIREKARAARALSPGDQRRRLALGVDRAAFDAMFAAQGSKCAVCCATASTKWTLDHAHDSGRVRAVLCNRCNLGLGLFSDDAARMRAAADYVERHQRLQELL